MIKGFFFKVINFFRGEREGGRRGEREEGRREKDKGEGNGKRGTVWGRKE